MSNGIHPRHMALHVIRPTLALVGDGMAGFDSDPAIELLLGTIAAESGFYALDQITGPGDTRIGPAYGLYQIEPATLEDLFRTYLHFRPELRNRLNRLAADAPSPIMQLVTNLAYATAVARLIYWRQPHRLAPCGDVAGHARVWKAAYNTTAGKGTEEHFIAAWQRHVAPFI